MTKIHFGVTRPVLSFDGYVDWVKLVESQGYELIGLGDSQHRWADLTACSTLAAAHTSKVMVGSFITNPVTRHPTVTANAVNTLQKLSNGRYFCGIGMGETSVRDLGRSSVPLDELEQYIQTVRTLLSGEPTNYRGERLQMIWDMSPAPLWVAGDGPQILQLAGRIGDAVISGNGATPELVTYVRDQVAIGARQAGRDPADIAIWFMVRVYVAPTEEEGLESFRYYLASYANTRYQAAMTKKGLEVPPDIQDKLRGLRAEFRYAETLRPDRTFNADLVDKYGLREWLGRQFAITGPPDQCIEKLEAVARAGGTHLVLPQMHPDIMGTTEVIGRTILPAFS